MLDRIAAVVQQPGIAIDEGDLGSTTRRGKKRRIVSEYAQFAQGCGYRSHRARAYRTELAIRCCDHHPESVLQHVCFSILRLPSLCGFQTALIFSSNACCSRCVAHVAWLRFPRNHIPECRYPAYPAIHRRHSLLVVSSSWRNRCSIKRPSTISSSSKPRRQRQRTRSKATGSRIQDSDRIQPRPTSDPDPDPASSYRALHHHVLDLADGLGRIQFLRAHIHAIHDGVATEQTIRIFQIIQTLAAVSWSRVSAMKR